MQWKNVYAATGVGPQSPSLRGPAWPWGLRRGTSKRAKGHERDLVIQLRDYEANGGDLDAIRQHIDDAASVRVWDMFLANYKCFSRTGLTYPVDGTCYTALTRGGQIRLIPDRPRLGPRPKPRL